MKAPAESTRHDDSQIAPCYAVIFESQLAGDCDYDTTASAMVALAQTQPGFLSVSSARSADGFGITISYWSSLEAVRAFRALADHRAAQALGRSRFYIRYRLCVAEVKYEREFDRSEAPGAP